MDKPLCWKCKKEPPVPTKTLCHFCHRQILQQKMKHDLALAAKAQQHQQQQQQQLCLTCQKNPPTAGKQYCEGCFIKYRREKAAAAAAPAAASQTRLCHECKFNPANPNKDFCSPCFKKMMKSEMREKQQQQSTVVNAGSLSAAELQTLREKAKDSPQFLTVREKMILHALKGGIIDPPPPPQSTAAAAAAQSTTSSSSSSSPLIGAPAAVAAAAAPCSQCTQLGSEISKLKNALKSKDSEIGHLISKNLHLEKLLASQQQNQQQQEVFLPDQPWRLNFAAAGIQQQLEPGQVAAVPFVQQENGGEGQTGASAAAAAVTPFQRYVQEQLWRTRGSMFPVPWQQGVSGFRLVGIDVVNPEGIAGFEDRLRRLQRLRQSNAAGSIFNPPTTAWDAEQLQLLIMLKDIFIPRRQSAAADAHNRVNVLWSFHGTRVERLSSVLGGLVSVRETDSATGNFFGHGVYITPNICYAADYAVGKYDPPPPDLPGPVGGKDDGHGTRKGRASDGAFPVVMCCSAVGVAYPITVKDVVPGGNGHVKYLGKAIEAGFDSAVAPIREPSCLCCPTREVQHLEIVADQESAVLPVAVLWVKRC